MSLDGSVESILLRIVDAPLSSISLMIAVAATYAGFISAMLGRLSSKRESNLRQFFKVLKAGILNGSLDSPTDIENIYFGIRRQHKSNGYNKAALANWLRQFLVEVISDKDVDPKLLEAKVKIDQLIEEIETEHPYEALPSLERSLFLDLEEVNNQGEYPSIARKLEQLKTAILAREDSINKLRSTNRWSVPLSILGLILTVLFGVLSLLPLFASSPAA